MNDKGKATPEAEKTVPSQLEQIELQEIWSSLRHVHTIRAQVLVFLWTANVTIIGLGLSSRRAGLIMLAPAVLLMQLFVELVARDYAGILEYRGFEIERRCVRETPGLFTYYIAITVREPTAFLDRLRKIGELSTIDERTSELRKLFYRTAMPILTLVLLCILLELLVGVVLFRVSGWQLF